jgi:hypothetical protein
VTPHLGDEPGRLPYTDERQLSTEGRFVRQRRRASSAEEVHMVPAAKKREKAPLE